MFTYKRKYMPFLMWLFPLLFFAYQFILRLWPSLTMQQIMHQFSIDASGFGLLAALYYYGYAWMQIPVAMLLDRFGARYVVLSCAVLCGVAVFVFSCTNHWYLACFSRFLIGVGSAAGFLGVSKVISQWFPKDQYARMIGFSFTFGFMGAIYGGKPTSLLVESYGWQNVAFVLAGVSMALGLGAYLFLRAPSNRSQDSESEAFKLAHFKTLLTSPAIWLLAVGNLLMVGSLEGFADVWGVQFLMTAYSLEKSDAAELVSYIFVGMLFGGPLLAAFARILGNYKVISLCGAGMSFAFVLLLTGGNANWYWLASLFFCIGVMCCYQVIVFAAGSNLVSAQLLCITVALLNCINMLGGSFFHTCIGLMMDLFWSGNLDLDGTRAYGMDSYVPALSVIPLCALLGACIIGMLGVRQKQRLTQLQEVS